MARVPHDLTLTPSVLDRLLDDDPHRGSLEFHEYDLRNSKVFVEKIRQGTDPLSEFMQQQMSQETLQALREWDGMVDVPQHLMRKMLVDLNLLLKRQSLFETTRFAHVRLSKHTLRMLDESLPGTVSLALNRILIEEAYPDDFWKRKKQATSYSVQDLKNDVSRDLANLLNTRRETMEEELRGFNEVTTSLVTYGLPDFTAYSLLSMPDRKKIRRGVEQAIANFEPRLRNVRVTLDPAKKFDQVLRFRIEALLRVEPSAEPVVFDAVLQMATQEYAIKS